MKSLWLSIFTILIAPLASASDNIFHIQVQGSINPGSSSFIQNTIDAANKEKAQAVVIQLDTPGGLLTSTRDIMQKISSSEVPVVLFVGPSGARATSAGALIALSSHIVAMAPGTNIGAAHPVGGNGEEVKGPMGDKVTNDTAALARSQASLRGRDVTTAEKIVTKSLSLSSDEAIKAKIADLLANDLNDLLEKIHNRTVTVNDKKVTLSTAGAISKSLVLEKKMTQKESFLHIISDPNISTLLMAIGGMAIYAEVSSGFTLILPGLFGLFCLLLGFVSLQTLPIHVGGLILFGLGFVLLAAEVFITSYGLLTIGAMACLFIGGLFLLDPASTDMRVSWSILLAILGSFGFIGAVIAYLFQRERPANALQSESDHLKGLRAKVIALDADGKTGSLQINGEIWKFESKGPVLLGAEVLVDSVKGMVVQIRS